MESSCETNTTSRSQRTTSAYRQQRLADCRRRGATRALRDLWRTQPDTQSIRWSRPAGSFLLHGCSRRRRVGTSGTEPNSGSSHSTSIPHV